MNLYATIIAIVILTVFANSEFINSETAEVPIQNCEVKAANPIRFYLNDYANGNQINAKLRVNQPFGLYTNRDGFIKWETLFRARDCNYNYLHHVYCNIVTALSPIETSFELNIWRNCSWNYAINRRQISGNIRK